MNQTVVYPGDLIGGGYRHVESQWWHDIKNGMDNTHLLRKCDFLELIPDTGESCPGVATQSDHYFCIFGTSDGPSWYCTCYEHQGDYHFHCNPSDIMSVEQIREENTTPSVNIITHSLNFESDTIDKHVSETLKEADISTTKTDSQGEAKLLKTNKKVVNPGDLIGGGYKHDEYQWWHDIKDKMENKHILRKCDFIEEIPDNGESCPGVATHSDHYFCIFGTSDGPSWYCTCYEHQGDYHFHCNRDKMMSVEKIQGDTVVNTISHSMYFENDTAVSSVENHIEEASFSGYDLALDTSSNSIDFENNTAGNSVNTKTYSQGEVKLVKTNETVVHPGDLIGGGYKHDEYQWWHDIKDKMENKHILRKCDFIEQIPDNGESCPGVATHSDHYFCIFGTSDGPSWYCTCYEHQGDYHFHCNRDKMMSVEQVQGEDNAAMVVIHDTVLYENSNNKNASSGVSSFSSSGSSGMLAASLLNPNEKNKQDDKVGRSDTFDIGVGLLCGILAVVVIIVIHRRSRRGRYQYNKAIDYTLGGTTFPESAYPRSSRPPGVTLPINEKVLQWENSLIFV